MSRELGTQLAHQMGMTADTISKKAPCWVRAIILFVVFTFGHQSGANPRNCWKNFRLVTAKKAVSKSVDLLKENALVLSPLAIVPGSALVMGGDLSGATLSGAELAASLVVIDKYLETIYENAEHVISPEQLVILLATTTNVPEAGAAITSALVGDPILETPSTPYGSNWANPVLGIPALALALKARAVGEGVIQSGEKLSWKTAKKTLATMDWKSIRKQYGWAAVFAIDALVFRYWVMPEAKKGNYFPLAGWLPVNVPLIAPFFISIFSKTKRMGQLMLTMEPDSIELVKQKGLETSSPGFQSLAHAVVQQDAKQAVIAIKNLKTEIASDEKLKQEMLEFMEDADAMDVRALLRMGGVSKVSKSAKKKAVGNIVGGLIAIALASMVLDDGVTRLGEALQISKSAGGFFFLALFSSLPELMATAHYLKISRKANPQSDASAAGIISESNRINLIIGKIAMLVAYLKTVVAGP